MGYCKRCVCGHMNVYEIAGGGPAQCTACGRPILRITEEPYFGQPEPKKEPEQSTPVQQTTPSRPGQTVKYMLKAPDSSVFPLTEDTVVGRQGLAHEYLINFPDVSRKHFTLSPSRSGVHAVLTDESSYGTYINGEKVAKHEPVFVTNGSQIRLASRAVLTFVIEGGSTDD